MSPNSKTAPLKFGEFIRKSRLELDIGLREFARQIGISAAYVSRMEMGDEVPKEENIKKMAKILKIDEDKLFFMADRLSSDVKDIINTKPDLYISFLRKAKPKDVERFIKEMDENKKEKIIQGFTLQNNEQ